MVPFRSIVATKPEQDLRPGVHASEGGDRSIVHGFSPPGGDDVAHVHVHYVAGSIDFCSVPAAVVGQVACVSDWQRVGNVVGAAT